MQQNVLNVCVLAMIFTGLWAPSASQAEVQANHANHLNEVPRLMIQGKVVHVAAGDFWGILSDDGKKYDPGTLPDQFRIAELPVQLEAKLVKKRAVRMWGKPIEILQIDTPAVQHAAQHHHQTPAPGYQRSVHDYKVPDIDVIEARGGAMTSTEVFNTEKTLVVSFIFTSCTAICPILTATLSQTQQQLGPYAEGVRIVSISIDPEYDTPVRLREYAQRFAARGDWNFLTGDPDALRVLQRAFDADRGGKNNHQPLALIRRAGQQQWVRLDGFTSAEELAYEIQSPAGS